MLKEALRYIADLGVEAGINEVVTIAGKTYATKDLTRYDNPVYAEAVKASTLTSLVEYISRCEKEFKGDVMVHIVSPTRVRLISELDEERSRETLFEANAETSEFRFNQWYDQENFMISLQANFQMNDDLEAVMKLSGNIEKKNGQTFSDDGISQVATMRVGITSKADALVPNPVELIPHRTFQEIEQPVSKFVFRIGDKEAPAFKLVEADGGIWKNHAVAGIKRFLHRELEHLDQKVRERIVIIG